MMTLEREQSRDRAAHYNDDLDAHEQHVAPGRVSQTAFLQAPRVPMVSGLIQRKASNANGVAEHADQAVAHAASSGGESLPDALREKFETSLGADLSNVRVHTGAESARAAEAVGARAYAIGSDIHFAAGEYDPSSAGGQELIAHEVAHTVQQQSAPGKRQNKLEVSEAGDSAEHEADRAAAAMVSGSSFAISSATSTLSRKGKDHALSADDKSRLQNAKSLLDKAKANIKVATTPLETYAKASSGLFEQISTTFEDTKKVYARAQDSVDRCVDKAVAVEATRQEVLNTLMNAAMGAVTTKLLAAYSDTNAAYRRLEQADQAEIRSMKNANALVSLKQFDGEVTELGGPIADKGKGAAKDGAGEATGQGPVTAPHSDGGAGDKLQFVEQLLALRTKAASLPLLALALGKLGEPLGAAGKELELMLRENKTMGKEAKDLETDCANVWNGSQGLAGAGPSVAALTPELKAVAAQAAASKPKTDREIEIELWIRWAAKLPRNNLGAMNLDGVAKRCKALGIWDQLGIDPTGFWAFDDERALAHCSALAQTKIVEHKGTAVNVTLIDGHALEDVSLPGLPPLRAHIEGANDVRGQDSRQIQEAAVVIGATAVKRMSKEALRACPPDANLVVEYMLKHGYFAVVLRVYKDPNAPEKSEPA